MPASPAQLPTTQCPPGRMFTSLLLTQSKARSLLNPPESPGDSLGSIRDVGSPTISLQGPDVQGHSGGAINHAGKAVGYTHLCKVLPLLLWGTPTFFLPS